MFSRKIGGFVLLLGACIGVVAAHPGGHPAMGHSDEMVAHVNGMLQFVYDGVGATEAQKTQLATLGQGVQVDLDAMHASMAQTHEQAFGVLTQDTIDCVLFVSFCVVLLCVVVVFSFRFWFF